MGLLFYPLKIHVVLVGMIFLPSVFMLYLWGCCFTLWKFKFYLRKWFFYPLNCCTCGIAWRKYMRWFRFDSETVFTLWIHAVFGVVWRSCTVFSSESRGPGFKSCHATDLYTSHTTWCTFAALETWLLVRAGREVVRQPGQIFPRTLDKHTGDSLPRPMCEMITSLL